MVVAFWCKGPIWSLNSAFDAIGCFLGAFLRFSRRTLRLSKFF